MKRRILLTGGGTAGSVTPLMALAAQLRRLDDQTEFLFVGTMDGPERTLATAGNLAFHALPSGKWRRYWSWQNVIDLGQLWRAYWQARRLLQQWRPDVVVSAGSYVSVPVVWAAHALGLKTLIHQQDIQPGLANRLMAPFADRITVSFEKSLQDFPRHKVQWTGNPVRPEILLGSADAGRKLFQLPTTSPVLLILGGGTGSAYLNQVISATAFKLVRQWSIIHITGSQRDFPELRHEHYHPFPFLTWQLPHALAVADVVISRAGLGAFSELAALGKAAIFVPMPASHQEQNADVIRQAKAGLVIEQDKFDQAKLLDTTNTLLAHPAERQLFGQNLHQFYRPDAVVRLADEVLHLIAA